MTRIQRMKNGRIMRAMIEVEHLKAEIDDEDVEQIAGHGVDAAHVDRFAPDPI